ncbi:helix-turn-helix transcriptional regulator [Apilactobacillus sp. EABW-1NA]|uniref:helix-turn-helix domain-containing protein n=1 Tax=Apilactobacillus sp. EABW-1NA TaxID=2984137 RepID=UPI0025B11E02|nr:helix-turn-helix transcriptional regulator [Apilactobacillus sp. EABW-1NA]MDN2612978.1 helix-turn-helix domain-containing protein [Apilactobacillus sp. EABW-1NA]
MHTNKQIMDIIEQQRAKKRMSMEELGKLTDTSRASISRYKNGSRDFPVNKAHLFAQALGITTSQLLGMNEVEDKNLTSTINRLNEENRKSLYEYAQFLLQSQEKND